MVTYVPGTEESDHKKQNMSLQQIGPKLDTAITNVATNTANIVTNTTNIATNTSAITVLQTPNYGLVNSGGALGVSLSKITAALGADVALNNIANYFDGPSVAQGATGTWFVTGTVTLADTGATAAFNVKLWDGTTVIASARTGLFNIAANISVSLSGFLTSPAGNLRISVNDPSATTGKIVFNATGNSKDSTISAYRIA